MGMGWDGCGYGLGWDGMEWEGFFLHVSVMTQVANVNVVPIAQLNA